MSSTALVTVVNGQAYHDYAEQMFESAREHFHPTDRVEFVKLDGPAGWPAATMMRYHVLSRHLPRANFVFLIDADMLFVGPVGAEILPRGGRGVTATLHPGYVGVPREQFPYEALPESACYVPSEEGHAYFCGGFVGGERLAVRMLAAGVEQLIDVDLMRSYTPRWHDESALNRLLSLEPPDTVLDPRYCVPGGDLSWYRSFWQEDYSLDARLVAVEKDAETRGDR